MGKLSQLEKKVMIKLNCRCHPAVERLMLFVTKLGNGGMIWIAVSIFLALSGRRTEGFLTIIALGVTAFLINLVIKPMFTRKRPYELIQSVRTKLNPPFGSSFPSGHAASSFAAAAMLWLVHAPYWGLALALAGMIALSRVYLCVHFPSDVLAGVISGIVISYVTYLVACRVGGQFMGEWLEQQAAWWMNQVRQAMI